VRHELQNQRRKADICAPAKTGEPVPFPVSNLAMTSDTLPDAPEFFPFIPISSKSLRKIAYMRIIAGAARQFGRLNERGYQ
jgi:hypothetical protein